MFMQEWEVDESGENPTDTNNALTEGQELQQSCPRLETGS